MMDDEIRIPPPGYRSTAERRAEDMKRMVLIGAAAGVALLVCIVGYVVVAGSGSGSVPVVQAPATPVKEKPQNPGGLAIQTPTGALPTGGSGQSMSLAPAPEMPDPSALAAEAHQEQPPSPPSSPASSATLGSSALPASSAAAGAAGRNASTPPPAAAVSVPSVPEHAAPSQSRQTAIAVPPPSHETAKVHNLAQEYHPPASHAGPVKVQLAALDSKAAAERAWEHISRRMPGLFAGRHPIFVEAQVDGRTFWRVRLGGFDSTAAAKAFCENVHAHGGACTIAAF